MSYQTLILENLGPVLLIRMNEPAVLNALSEASVEELSDALRVAADSYRAVVLTGAGPSFCAGARLSTDIPEDLGLFLRTHLNPLIDQIRAMPIPCIHAVRGACAGGGSSLALAGDIIVAGEGAYFQQVFVRIGLIPDCGAFHMLVRTIGRVRAMQMMLLGERLPAPKALGWGLVSRVVPDADVETVAIEIARTLAAGPRESLAAIRQLAWAALDDTWDRSLEHETVTQSAIGRTFNAREGISAFLEKRPAKFAE
ncbi:enoyl-CoA hydratase-related protein [Novosphingobium sp. 9U]|uniref:enoyl-CoA hydratase-related protein n=1 Tax=Novosphingobium sp. 9U TaxID=2653158 RepID=UPI0012EF1309|nr:enoyl-CoA hydratase-related protein [Novosphingobium sp. 9U]VWX50580.1 putative enoyl-CoA hydratase [Novosphingobium sp. 9U]